MNRQGVPFNDIVSGPAQQIFPFNIDEIIGNVKFYVSINGGDGLFFFRLLNWPLSDDAGMLIVLMKSDNRPITQSYKLQWEKLAVA